VISAETRGVLVQVLFKNSTVAKDYRTNRVRVFVDETRKVVNAPGRG
jgi:hypothetical protein